MVTEIKIERIKSGSTKSFIFEEGEVKLSGNSTVSQSASISIIKDNAYDSAEDFTIDLGAKKVLNFEWILYKQDNDRSEGTNSTAIKTFEEMLNFLEDIILFPGIGIVEYKITITDKFRSRQAIYSYEDSAIDIDSGIRPKGNMKFNWKRQVI